MQTMMHDCHSWACSGMSDCFDAEARIKQIAEKTDRPLSELQHPPHQPQAAAERITGRLVTAGRITTCENYPQEFDDDLNFDVTSGILIEMTDDELRAAAGNLLGKTIEVRPVDSAEQAVIAAAVKYREACEAVASSALPNQWTWDFLGESQRDAVTLRDEAREALLQAARSSGTLP